MLRARPGSATGNGCWTGGVGGWWRLVEELQRPGRAVLRSPSWARAGAKRRTRRKGRERKEERNEGNSRFCRPESRARFPIGGSWFKWESAKGSWRLQRSNRDGPVGVAETGQIRSWAIGCNAKSPEDVDRARPDSGSRWVQRVDGARRQTARRRLLKAGSQSSANWQRRRL